MQIKETIKGRAYTWNYGEIDYVAHVIINADINENGILFEVGGTEINFYLEDGSKLEDLTEKPEYLKDLRQRIEHIINNLWKGENK